MQSHRVFLPIEHLKAEIAAFPLSSMAALQLATTSLEPDLGIRTQQLWREAERALVQSFPSVSIDELVALRDQIWFPNGPEDPVSLVAHMRRLAQSIFAPAGDAIRLCTPHVSASEVPVPLPKLPPEVLARDTWRWLTFAIPEDLLLASCPFAKDAAQLQFISPVLQRLLESGFAETHLHIGAAIDFSSLWIALLYALASAGITEADFESPGAEFREGRDLAAWLIRIAIARCILAVFLCSPTGAQGRSLRNFVESDALYSFQVRASRRCAILLQQALSDLEAGRLSGMDLPFSDLRALYTELTATTMRQVSGDLQCVGIVDPIHSVIRTGECSGCNPEATLCRLGMLYLEEHPRDLFFAALFHQVIRIRNLFYRHVVQRPLTPGLQWFIRFFARLKPAKKFLPHSHLLKLALEQSGFGRGLHSLEIRTAPGDQQSAVWRIVQTVDSTLKSLSGSTIRSNSGRLFSSQGIEVGVVFHFSRDRGGGARQGRPAAFAARSHANPAANENLGGYRFATFYRQKRLEALALAQILLGFPVSLEIVRGLDACTDENGVPAWVLAPLFRYVRDAGQAASRALRHRLGHFVPPLRSTMHVGEEFPHLLSGLRRIDEAIRYLGLQEGDRLGHSIALGIDATAWATGRGHVVFPREERLLDLVWEWTFYNRTGLNPPSQRLPLIEREVARLSQQVFGFGPIGIFDLECMVEDLHDELCLRTLGFPDGPIPTRTGRLTTRHLLVLQHLTDPAVFARGQVLEQVFPEREADALEALQAGLRRVIATRGLTVEINPSSNLLIGDLRNLQHHPMWRLNPPRPIDSLRGDFLPLAVCIGSDDPITFATSLPGEYQLLMDAMLSAGLSDWQCRQWLDNARKAGMDARFTLQRSGLALTELSISDPPTIDDVL